MLKLYKHLDKHNQIPLPKLSCRTIFIMKYLLFTFIFSSTAFLSFSQKIKGVVSDNNGNILPFSSIFIKENNKGTNANSEGKYSLKLEPGQYTLVCQHVGYKKEERKPKKSIYPM